MTLRKLIAGNWKMHGSLAALAEIETIAAAARALPVDVLICPPFPFIAAAVARSSGIAIGAQDCHPRPVGAHTGCVSAMMLAEAGARYCIVGHSERRTDQCEDDAEVRAKAEAVLGAQMTPIICVGETLAEREAGQAVRTVETQLAGSLPEDGNRVVIAYEPVWAIGTGRTPTTEDVARMHAAIRDRVGPAVRILYGGSVKPANARELLHVVNVDGALVGGASLLARDFVPIIEAAVAAPAEVG